MNKITNLLISCIVSFWLALIAVFSIQNITDVSLKFVVFESIKLPVGVLLSFSAGGGMLLGGMLPLLFSRSDND